MVSLPPGRSSRAAPQCRPLLARMRAEIGPAGGTGRSATVPHATCWAPGLGAPAAVPLRQAGSGSLETSMPGQIKVRKTIPTGDLMAVPETERVAATQNRCMLATRKRCTARRELLLLAHNVVSSRDHDRLASRADESPTSLMTQCMVRPCVARSFVDLVCGLASMYPASDWSGSLLRATMDISARSI